MVTTDINPASTVHSILAADGRSADIPEEHDAYGWLVGSWVLDVHVYWQQPVLAKGIQGEAHFAWVLEGRAIQDVWIMPRMRDRSTKLDSKLNMYGTTLRVWDATLKAWRISWLNPAGQHFEQQIGRKAGADVVQIGTRPDGTPTRWRFTEITPESFHWLGESLKADGRTWILEGEFRARRHSAPR